MTLFEMLARTAAAQGDAPALRFRGQTMSYGALAETAERFAGGLSALGVRKRDRVALLLPNSPQFAIAYLAASRAGASLIPLNVLYRPDEARYILADADAEVLITAEPFRPLVQALRPHLPHLKHVVMVSEGAAAADEVAFRALCTQEPGKRVFVADSDVAVILYTSGTTGRPKGAMLTHHNLLANVASCVEVLHPRADDCFLSALPLFHAFAAMVFLLLPVRVGACTQLMERFLPANCLQLLVESRATVFGGVPSMIGLLLQISRETKPDLSALRLCVSGGAPLPPEIWLAFEEAYAVKMVEGYGLTEASPVVAVNPPDGLRKPGSIGLPIPGVEVKILAEDGQVVGPEVIGELVVRGENVMKGYLQRRADTAQAIRGGWLHTGDLARMDADGYLYIAGRKKELIIVGGLNVYPGEVERVLVEHPAVLEAAAFGVPDNARGEAVWAAVTLRPSEHVSEKALQAHCREKLAPYKVPRGIDIREELPKNALGKIVRHLLHEEVTSRLRQPVQVET